MKASIVSSTPRSPAPRTIAGAIISRAPKASAAFAAGAAAAPQTSSKAAFPCPNGPKSPPIATPPAIGKPTSCCSPNTARPCSSFMNANRASSSPQDCRAKPPTASLAASSPCSPPSPSRCVRPSPSTTEPSSLATRRSTSSPSKPTSATPMPLGKRAESKTPSAAPAASSLAKQTSPSSQINASSPSSASIITPQENASATKRPPRSSSNCCTSSVNPPSRLRGNDRFTHSDRSAQKDAHKAEPYEWIASIRPQWAIGSTQSDSLSKKRLRRELKAFEAIELAFDERFVRPGRALARPRPFLDEQSLLLPIRLQIDDCDDFVVDQGRQREIAEDALFLWRIGLETVVVIEEQLQALALDDQRIEGRQDMSDRAVRLDGRLDRRRLGPMLDLAGAVDRYRREPALANPRLDKPADSRLARRVEMTDGIEADHALRAQGAVEQVFQNLPLGSGLRPAAPAEMPLHQLVGLDHAVALADRQRAGIEGELQRPLGWLAARPSVVFLDQHVVVDVADRQRTLLADARQDLAQVLLFHPAKP